MMLVLYLEPNQLIVVPLTNVQGVLSDKSEVCVKLLTTSVQGVAEFLNEVILLTGIRHQNLVKLKGCCLNESQRIVVYEFVENRNLAEALWDAPSNSNFELDWQTRFNICLGIARGLAYLHDKSQLCIVHGDMKAQNILLDKNLNPRIGDFGLAHLFPDEKSHLTTVQVAGTL
jgi:serine/threonine protein kinase